MIKEYRKKTTIKAEQFDGSNEMMRKYSIWTGEDALGRWYKILTNEGIMTFMLNDWIATGIDGEHWAIADDIFRRTYEEVKGND